jgi:hypothetical protein
MSSAVWHELGDVPGSCTACGSPACLSMGEARLHRTVVERVRRQYSAAPARFIRCSACGGRWSVRAGYRPGAAEDERTLVWRTGRTDEPSAAALPAG